MIILTLKEQPSVPLEAEALSPDVMAGLAPRCGARPSRVLGQAPVPRG